MRTGSATAAFCRPVAQGRQLSPEDPATVGDGDALPGGREEVRDAGMQDEWRGLWQYKKDIDK